MEEVVQQVVAGDAAAAEAGTASVLSALKDRSLSVLGLVALLQRPLTDEQDHESRARAVQLLSKVVSEAPDALQSGDVGVMADFLSAKLQDWRCVDAAVPGCLALLQRHKQAQLAPLPEPAAIQVITRFCSVHVQGLVYKGRLSCYELMLEIFQGPYGVPAVLQGTNLVEFTVVAMENEADPRCLILALQCVKAVGNLYQHADLADVTHLDDGLEDLFDVGVVPYFPMMFTPPKNDQNKITRDELLGHVIQAMACCPQFAALGVPLLSEKLGSSLKQAKGDSLLALPVCMKGWGAAAVKPHIQAVWLMLKAELMAPATAEASTPDQLASRYAAATAAAAALTQCITALGPGLLDIQVLSDVAVEDLMQYLGLVDPPWSRKGEEPGVGPGVTNGTAAAGWDLPEKAQKRLACIARIVAAVAAAGGSSCTAVCQDILQPALRAVLDDTAAAAAPPPAGSRTGGLRPVQANCAVLCVLHCVLKAVAEAAAPNPVDTGAAAAAAQYGALADLVPSIAAAIHALQHADGSSTAVQGSDLQSDHVGSDQLQIWILLIWQDLLTLDNSIAPLQQQQLDTAAEQLVQLALSDSSSSSRNTKLDLDPDGSSSTYSMAAAAVTALTKLAAWPPAAANESTTSPAAAAAASGMQAVKQHAAPVLLNLLSSSSSSSGGDQLAKALSVLQQVAGSSAAAAWEVLTWLRPLVLDQLQQSNADGLCRTLPILHSCCIPALPADLSQQQSAEAAAFASELLQSWQQQQQQQQDDDGGGSLASANARYHSCLLLSHLLAKCSVQDQQMLMLNACEQVVTAAAAASGCGGGGGNSTANAAARPAAAAAVAAAVLAAARPGVLTAESVLDLADALAALCTAASSSSSSSSANKLDKAVAGVALGSVVHKCIVQQRSSSGGVKADALLAAVLPRLLTLVQQQQDSLAASNQDVLGALQALSWVGRGLAMQRHDAWLQCMQQVLLLLPVLTADSPGGSELVWAAAEFFAVVVASPLQGGTVAAAMGSITTAAEQQQQQSAQLQDSSRDLGLKLNLHWVGRPLWQQKVFTIALDALSKAVSSGNPTGDHQQQQQGILGLWLAVANLLSATPAGISSTAREQVVPLLLRSLAQLSNAAPGMLAATAAAGSLAAEAAAARLLHLLQDSLLMLADVLMSAANQPVQELLTPHVEQLLTVLCQLATLTVPRAKAGKGGGSLLQQPQHGSKVTAATAVRELALMNLTSVMGLQYHLLHPYRRQVLTAVTAALDDDRRAVRKAAVVCRTSWTMN